MAIGAMTTFTRNAQRHEKSEVSTPPTYGPSAPAPPAIAPHTANATPRSRPWKVAEMIDNVAGSMAAAPRPSSSDSPRKSCVAECDMEANSEPRPKRVAPIRKRRRRPKMSPRRPKLISSEANTSE